MKVYNFGSDYRFQQQQTSITAQASNEPELIEPTNVEYPIQAGGETGVAAAETESDTEQTTQDSNETAKKKKKTRAKDQQSKSQEC